MILEQLDRALLNIEWMQLFPGVCVKHLPRIASDHAPLLLNTYLNAFYGYKSFRFEKFWS